MALEAGTEAPDFELRSHRGGTVRLSDFRGKKNVVLAFHPLAFTPVCATQMSGYESNLPRLERDDAVVLGISIDPQPSKTAWASARSSADWSGASRQKEGFSERAVFVVGKDGRVKWVKTYDIPEQPDNEELLAALDRLGSA